MTRIYTEVWKCSTSMIRHRHPVCNLMKATRPRPWANTEDSQLWTHWITESLIHWLSDSLTHCRDVGASHTVMTPRLSRKNHWVIETFNEASVDFFIRVKDDLISAEVADVITYLLLWKPHRDTTLTCAALWTTGRKEGRKKIMSCCKHAGGQNCLKTSSWMEREWKENLERKLLPSGEQQVHPRHTETASLPPVSTSSL